MTLPKRFAVSVQQMRDIDRRTVEEYHIPIEVLMENAGKAVADECRRVLLNKRIGTPCKILAVCGGGNNGGDGFVAARMLHSKTIRTKTLLLKPLESLQDAARFNFERIQNSSIPYELQPKFGKIKREIEKCDLIIDALLGTGVKNEVTGLIQQTILAVNGSKKPVVSVDIPSGLDADTGTVHGHSIRAHRTVTMGALKLGFLKRRSQQWTGKVVVADIGFPKELIQPRR